MDNDGKKTEQEAIKTAEKADGEQFNKERQRADQAEANVRKLLNERNQLTSQFTTLQSQIQQQQQELQKLSSTKQVLDEIPEIDAETASVEDLVKVAAAMKKTITAQAKKLASLEGKARQFENLETNRAAQSERNGILEEVCAELETEFGAGLRNDALKIMAQINEEQGPPANSAKATLCLRTCFKQAKEARIEAENKTTEKKKSNIPPGEGGGHSSFKSQKFTKGSLKEVYAQAKKIAGAGKGTS